MLQAKKTVIFIQGNIRKWRIASPNLIVCHIRNQKKNPFVDLLKHVFTTKSITVHEDNDNNSFQGYTDSSVKILCRQGRLNEALHKLRGLWVDFYTYSSLLQCCINMKTLTQGKLVHAHMVESGGLPDVFLETKLMIMYTKCQSLKDACKVFDKMPERNIVSWNAMIGAYTKNGYFGEALKLFYQMQQTSIQADEFTFASVIHVCANLVALEDGRKVHVSIIRSGCEDDIFVENALVNMYCKCGSIEDACNVFEEMAELDVVSWSTMIAGYAQTGYFDEAMRLFRQMQVDGMKPDSFTLASVLPACGNFTALEQGKEIHEHVIRSGFQSNIFVGNALVDMYVKCGCIEDAWEVFDKMTERNVVSWTAMIAGYAQNGCIKKAAELFQVMPERNVVSWTAMVAGYARTGCVDEAMIFFQEMPERNVVSWTAMISGYTQNGKFEEAMKFFREMRCTDVRPNSDTFASLLPACANLVALHEGQEAHADIIRNGFQSDVYVGNALVHMYAKCSSIEDARRVFDGMPQRDVVSWNAMIAGYAQSRLVNDALELFEKMPEKNVVSWNAMIAGFMQMGFIAEALKLFQEMPECDVISWTTMIVGYAQNGYYNEALQLFQQMQHAGVKPSSETFASTLSACASLATLSEGKEVHGIIIRCELQSDVFVGNSLIDMYAKCGSIEDAFTVFDKMPRRDVVSWNAIILGNAMHGYGKEALSLFQQMQHSKTKPDQITFVGVLSACCHAGLVDDGRHYFVCMSRAYHIIPSMEHYCCMVDLLGRAGLLDEAEDFINNMPIKPDAAVWGSLLGACRIHNYTNLGERVAKCLSESENKRDAHYVLLSNMYAVVGRWDDVEKVREMMKRERVEKVPGCSWIEVNNTVYAFLVGDRSHSETQGIYAKLQDCLGS